MDTEHEDTTGEGRPDTPAEQGISRKKFIAGTAAAGAAIGLGATGAALGARKAPATPNAGATNPDRDFEALVLRKGKIHTMDGSNRVVDEIRIENGRIVEVGDHVDPRNAKVINLKGRTVVPGIIDNHNHIILMGNRPGYHTPLENAYSVADVQQTFATRASGIPAGGWITTIGGFHSNHFAELRLPTRQELDAAIPANPAFILQGFTGPATTNSLGKTFFEANGVTVGRQRRDRDGWPAGDPRDAPAAPDTAEPGAAAARQRRRDRVRPRARSHEPPRSGRVPEDQHARRRRGARGQLHDAAAVSRAAPRRPAPGTRADQLPAHGERCRAARSASSGC